MSFPFEVVDTALVRAGFHITSPFWLNVMHKVATVRPRITVPRVGRRGGKTVTALRYMLSELLGRWWPIDQGDIGVCPIISAHKWQALDRIATMRKYCNAICPELLIGRPKVDRIDLQLPWGMASIRAFTATSAGVVSPTVIFALLDEVARWIDDRGRNPATEIIASLKPGLLSTGGTMWMISSPMGEEDAHAKAYALGDNDGQLVFHAPTWIAHPALTEEMCRELEPDELLFKREYAAIPMPSSGLYWMPHLFLDRAVDNGRESHAWLSTSAGGDMAFLRDASALVVNGADIDQTIGIKYLAEWRPIEEPLSPTIVTADAFKAAKAWGASAMMSDVHARANMLEAARNFGLAYRNAPINGVQWGHARRSLCNDMIALPSCEFACACCGKGVCDRLVAQLRRVRITDDAGVRLKRRHADDRHGHGDIAEAWALGVWQLRNAAARRMPTEAIESTWAY